MMIVVKRKPKKQKKCVIKIPEFNDYKDCLFKNGITLKSQQRFKSEADNVNINQINKIVLGSNNDKRVLTF